ncbi:MAG: cell division protein FtsL [Clostridia bacterium]|nr:cell division protein FtsL [Clostridia bacterium]
MAYSASSRYQYGTSPRKLEPEYRKVPKKYPKKSTMANNKKAMAKKKKIQKKAVIYVVIAFLAFFAISYRNSQIDEAFSKTEDLKENYQAIQKENEQIEVSIDNSLNLNNVEQSAKEQLGMQKMTNKQTVYVTLPKKDYIESDIDSSDLEQNKGVVEKVFDFFKNIF